MMMRHFYRPIVAPALMLVAWIAFTASEAAAQVRIDVTRGRLEPLPIAIVDFSGSSADEQRIGRDIAQVVSADLERSGLFRPIDSRAFIQTPDSLAVRPRFGDWRTVNAAALVHGNIRVQGGQLITEFRLWDVVTEQDMIGLRYNSTADNWRRIAHIVADAIYKRITGEDGYFDTRIVYISESGPAKRRIKRLAIMDQDGANHRFLTDGAALVLTPRFSPTLQEITYLSFARDQPRVYVLNIDSGRQELLGDFPGMTFAPRFSPDGKRVIMTLASDGNSEIYEMDLRTRAVKRLTRHPAIDTSPSYAPDGRRIAFNSDRGGSQQLYVMDAAGGNVKRISFGEGRYSTPVWSPRGDLIAFTKQAGGEFFIGVMTPEGEGERLLARAYLVEGPTWAPNGRVLMYFRQEPTNADGSGGGARLYSIDLTGHNERLIVTPADGSDPAWSPLTP